jgi:hypothetical protein
MLLLAGWFLPCLHLFAELPRLLPARITILGLKNIIGSFYQIMMGTIYPRSLNSAVKNMALWVYVTINWYLIALIYYSVNE